MTGKVKLLWSMVLMAMVIGISTEVASGGAIGFEPGGAIRLTSLGKLTFEAGISIACNWTLNGELRTELIPKVSGNPVGTITEARWRECAGGEIETVRGTPYSLTYQSILGTLPEAITGIKVAIERWDWKLSTFSEFIRCRWRGDAQYLLGVTGSNPYTSGLLVSLGNALSLVEGGGCPAAGTYRGSFRLATAQRITRVGTNILAVPSSLSFGRITAGEVARRTVMLEFETAARVTAFGVTTGTAFAATDPARCKGSEVARGGTCTFTVLFAPPSERRGTEYSDELVIETSIGNVRVPLTGGAS